MLKLNDVHNNNCKLNKNKKLEFIKHFILNYFPRRKLYENFHTSRARGAEHSRVKQKRYMIKFNRIHRQYFGLFLKRCKWRLDISRLNKLLVDFKKSI
jgi:hypothetical protein